MSRRRAHIIKVRSRIPRSTSSDTRRIDWKKLMGTKILATTRMSANSHHLRRLIQSIIVRYASKGLASDARRVGLATMIARVEADAVAAAHAGCRKPARDRIGPRFDLLVRKRRADLVDETDIFRSAGR